MAKSANIRAGPGTPGHLALEGSRTGRIDMHRRLCAINASAAGSYQANFRRHQTLEPSPKRTNTRSPGLSSAMP